MAILIAVPLFFDKNYWPSYGLPEPFADIVGVAILACILIGLYRTASK